MMMRRRRRWKRRRISTYEKKKPLYLDFIVERLVHRSEYPYLPVPHELCEALDAPGGGERGDDPGREPDKAEQPEGEPGEEDQAGGPGAGDEGLVALLGDHAYVHGRKGGGGEGEY